MHNAVAYYCNYPREVKDCLLSSGQQRDVLSAWSIENDFVIKEFFHDFKRGSRKKLSEALAVCKLRKVRLLVVSVFVLGDSFIDIRDRLREIRNEEVDIVSIREGIDAKESYPVEMCLNFLESPVPGTLDEHLFGERVSKERMLGLSKKYAGANTFGPFWDAHAQRLLSSAKLLSSLVSHSGEVGSSREILLREFLKEVVPSRFKVATGFLINRRGEASRQIDVIVYDSFEYAPIFSSGDLVVVPAEAAVSCTEVKSILDRKLLFEALANGTSIQGINRNCFFNIFSFASKSPIQRLATAYGDFLIARVRDVGSSRKHKEVYPCPTVISVLDRGNVYFDPSVPQRERGYDEGEIWVGINKDREGVDRTLGMFLQGILSQLAGYSESPIAPRLGMSFGGHYLPRGNATRYRMLVYNFFYNAWGWSVDHQLDESSIHHNSPFIGESPVDFEIPKGMGKVEFCKSFDKEMSEKLMKAHKLK